jgi:hypothetical protein
MEAADSSKTLEPIDRTTLRHISGDSNRYRHWREVKSSWDSIESHSDIIFWSSYVKGLYSEEWLIPDCVCQQHAYGNVPPLREINWVMDKLHKHQRHSFWRLPNIVSVTKLITIAWEMWLLWRKQGSYAGLCLEDHMELWVVDNIWMNLSETGSEDMNWI